MIFMLIIGAANMILSRHKEAPHPTFQLIIGVVCAALGLLEVFL